MFERFTLIAGPCVLEDDGLNVEIGTALAAISSELKLPIVFQASYDKANRTSAGSYRGPGLSKGLAIISRVKDEINVPVISDVHGAEEIGPAAEVCDILQIPAFLSRQTSLILAAADRG